MPKNDRSTPILSILEIKPDNNSYIVFMQATSPVRTPEDLDNGIRKIILENADSLFSGSILDDFCVWTEKEGVFNSLNYNYKKRGRRQEFEQESGKQYVENGSFYIFHPDGFLNNNNRLFGKITVSEMELGKSFEIDSMDDLDFLSIIFKNKILNKINKIKLIK